ncbi:MAG: homoserine kinase [Methylococcales bacterium]
MSVYTSLSFSQIQVFLSDYELGKLITFAGIQDGIANSNYALSTSQGEFILTVFETLTEQQVTRYIQLLEQLSRKHTIYPNPQPDRSAQRVKQCQQKPAVICARLPGTAITCPTIQQCAEIGEQLAKLHQATLTTAFQDPTDHNLPGLRRLFAKITALLSNDDRALINDELAFHAKHDHEQLPSGFIHGDLFKDNVLFVDGQISGIIDFYSACHDSLLRDIAITVNDWCAEQGVINQQKMHALLAGYERFRTLEPLEKQHWPAMLRMAALRFWLSRLVHQYHSPAGELTQQKNPLIFKQLLLQHREYCYA